MMVYLQCDLLGIDLKEQRSVRIYGSEVKDQKKKSNIIF